MNRRFFLRTTGLGLLGATLPLTAATRRGKVLVVIFQRGAVDGLNMIVPYGERAYAASRPSLAIPRNEVLDLDGFFGAHPSLQSLMPFWKDRSLAIVHAAGSPDATRSHFDAQDFMESGTPGEKSTKDGFLARAIGKPKSQSKSMTPRAVAITSTLPRIFSGAPDAIASADLAKFRNERASALFASAYPEAFEAARVLGKVDARGGPLKQIASLIKSDVGVEVAFTDVGGWDTHAAQKTPLANNLRRLSEDIAAFAKDLGSRMSDVVLVTMSEFGRTVRENGNRGTDHGHGGVMMLLGGNVRGGQVHGKWPGLEREQLFEGRDLAVTTDFRDVFGEVLTKHLGVASLAGVFPGHAVRLAGVL
ncbi:MAG TPA: DUF1501 domain-containing protein [Thermoanaerobaculia bacterium]|nr:DUF1501 domain-containing protein [Thermoanaerobaculia bacterium]